jgi:hypothetical protein
MKVGNQGAHKTMRRDPSQRSFSPSSFGMFISGNRTRADENLAALDLAARQIGVVVPVHVAFSSMAGCWMRVPHVDVHGSSLLSVFLLSYCLDREAEKVFGKSLSLLHIWG